jgi:hypothetical protein
LDTIVVTGGVFMVAGLAYLYALVMQRLRRTKAGLALRDMSLFLIGVGLLLRGFILVVPG